MMLGAALLACAVGVAPSTTAAIIAVESAGRTLAVHVNGWTGEQPKPATVADAAATAQRFIRMGYSVDLGLMQINSRNLDKLGYSIEDAFDDCKNTAGGARILSGFYGQAVQRFGEGQQALMAALSGYNTGSLWKGFENGYVRRYYINATLPVKTALPAVSPKPIPVSFSMVAYDRPGYSTAIQ